MRRPSSDILNQVPAGPLSNATFGKYLPSPRATRVAKAGASAEATAKVDLTPRSAGCQPAGGGSLPTRTSSVFRSVNDFANTLSPTTPKAFGVLSTQLDLQVFGPNRQTANAFSSRREDCVGNRRNNRRHRRFAHSKWLGQIRRNDVDFD